MGCVYLLKSPSGKSYVGITRRTLDERWAEHLKLKGRYTKALHAAIRKYGAAAFIKCILLESECWADLCSAEREFIAELGTLAPHGYNQTTGGDGVVGLSADAKERHRRNTSTATKAAWAEGSLRQSRAASFSKEGFKERHAEATARGTIAAFARHDVRARLVAKRREPEQRERVREQMKRLWTDTEYRANQTTKRRMRPPRSEESKLRQAEKMRSLIADRRKAGTYWLARAE